MTYLFLVGLLCSCPVLGRMILVYCTDTQSSLQRLFLPKPALGLGGGGGLRGIERALKLSPKEDTLII